MSTAKRPSMPRFLRRPLIARASMRLPARADPVLIRTVAFMPAYLRKRPH
mgnify:CR=1 FL=1